MDKRGRSQKTGITPVKIVYRLQIVWQVLGKGEGDDGKGGPVPRLVGQLRQRKHQRKHPHSLGSLPQRQRLNIVTSLQQSTNLNKKGKCVKTIFYTRREIGIKDCV